MASYSIRKRVKADGTARYQCFIRVKQAGKVVYSESKTFTKTKSAQAWGKKRVVEIEETREAFASRDGSMILLRELIQLYLDDPNITIGRTKRYVLQLLCDCDVGEVRAVDIKPFDIVEHCKKRVQNGTKPQTISHDVSYIRWALKSAASNFGYTQINDRAVVDAYDFLYNQRLISKSERRTRRPTAGEIDRIKEELEKRQGKIQAHIPYLDILDFSIFTCMRIGEVCSILWEDVDEKERSVIVRDRKDPRKKAGNHMVVPLLGPAWDILQSQSRESERVFPYNKHSVTAGFQRVRDSLGIKDLRYHDLRREGASRLFEMGYKIDEVAQVTGHRDINTLWKVYTELFPSRVHDKFKGEGQP